MKILPRLFHVKRLSEAEARDRYLGQYAADEEERLLNGLAPFGKHMSALVRLDLETG